MHDVFCSCFGSRPLLRCVSSLASMPWFLGNFRIARQTPPANLLLGTPRRKYIVFVLTNSVTLVQIISSTFFFSFLFSPPVYAHPFCAFLYT